MAVIGILGGCTYRYFADDWSENTFANYLRSSLHGIGLAFSGWTVHLYFTSRSTEWIRRWPLVVEIVVQSVVMAVVVATVAMVLQVVLYGQWIEPAGSSPISLVSSELHLPPPSWWARLPN